jgi:hypothetical protein
MQSAPLDGRAARSGRFRCRRACGHSKDGPGRRRLAGPPRAAEGRPAGPTRAGGQKTGARATQIRHYLTRTRSARPGERARLENGLRDSFASRVRTRPPPWLGALIAADDVGDDEDAGDDESLRASCRQQREVVGTAASLMRSQPHSREAAAVGGGISAAGKLVECNPPPARTRLSFWRWSPRWCGSILWAPGVPCGQDNVSVCVCVCLSLAENRPAKQPLALFYSLL